MRAITVTLAALALTLAGSGTALANGDCHYGDRHHHHHHHGYDCAAPEAINIANCNNINIIDDIELDLDDILNID